MPPVAFDAKDMLAEIAKCVTTAYFTSGSTFSLALNFPDFELPEGCRKALLDETFAPENAAKYLQADDPVAYLRDTMRAILSRFSDCDVNSLPLHEIADAVVLQTAKAVRGDHELVALQTLFTLENFKLSSIYTAMGDGQNAKSASAKAAAIRKALQARDAAFASQAENGGA
ncbi:MAG: hypothetical protein FWF69_01665 [Firmicutes bacterium]|nr:hypothetical protein [Bacillota bacterium]